MIYVSAPGVGLVLSVCRSVCLPCLVYPSRYLAYLSICQVRPGRIKPYAHISRIATETDRPTDRQAEYITLRIPPVSVSAGSRR